jgi:hypothetical protein
VNVQLISTLARDRMADLERDAEPGRLAAEWDTRPGTPDDSNRIARFSLRIARLSHERL